MKKIAACLGVLGFLSFSATAAEIRTFERKYQGHPKAGGNCHEIALAVGEAFQAASGAANVVAKCSADTKLGYNFSVFYDAEAPLAIVSTLNQRGTIDWHTPYKDLASCQTALAQEVATFETETKLKAAISFCAGDDPWSTVGFEARIEAFGTAARTPQVSEFYYFTVPFNLKGAELRSQVTAGMTALGATVRHVTFRSTSGHGTGSVSYYYESKIPMEVTEPSRHRSAEECAVELKDFNTFSSLLKPVPVAAYCGKTMIGGVETTVITVGPVSFTQSASIEKYAGHAECASSKPALLAYYREKLKRPVLGGLCGREEAGSKYVVMLYEQKASF